MVVAKCLSEFAALGTSFVAEKVGLALTSLGRFLAPHVHQQGSKLLSHTLGMENQKAEETITKTLKIAVGTANAVSMIYCGLESSVGILGKNLAENTVKVVKHTYGESSAAVTSNTFDTVGNLYNVRRFNIITPLGLVKATARNAAKDFLQLQREKN